MKKLLKIRIPFCEHKFVMLFMITLMLSCLLYFACYLYAFYRLLHPTPITPADGLVMYGYIRIRKKVEPFLKSQVFVRR